MLLWNVRSSASNCKLNTGRAFGFMKCHMTPLFASKRISNCSNCDCGKIRTSAIALIRAPLNGTRERTEIFTFGYIVANNVTRCQLLFLEMLDKRRFYRDSIASWGRHMHVGSSQSQGTH